MAGVFHGAGLVYGDVAGGGRHHALVVPEHRGDDGGIGLGAAGEEEYLGAGATAGFADAGFGRCGKNIGPVTGFLLQISSYQALQDEGMGAFIVVTGKGKHGYDKFVTSSMGQWSEPKISLWISVETMASFRDSDSTK